MLKRNRMEMNHKHPRSPSTLRNVFSLSFTFRASAGPALALTTVACLLNLPAPLLIQGLVDQVIGSGRWQILPLYAITFLGVCALQAGFNRANTLVIGRLGQSVVRDLRHCLYEKLQRLDIAYFDRTATGSIISRVMDDVAAIQTLVTTQAVTILTDLGTASVVSTMILCRSAPVALVVAAFVPLYALNIRYFMPRIRANGEVVNSKMDLIFGHLKEKLDGILVVKTHSAESAEISDFVGQLQEAHALRLRDNRLGAAFSILSGAISGVGTAVVFAVGAFEVLRGRLTPGGVVSIAALASLLFGPVARLADLAHVFEHAGTSAIRLGEILNLEPSIAGPDAPVPVIRARGRVELDRICFGYAVGEPVVRDVRLRIEPGMTIAVVGPTGCGKTTLVNLLLRFYDPWRGEIRLDGVPIQRLALADLRNQIGVVQQDSTVFRQSVADNIRYGNRGATSAKVEECAKAARVHDFASALPDGYETIVGEGGHPLSQGERQRLAIARVLCKGPSLIVLDEATNALDMREEALIHEAFRNLLRDRTALIIAHRLAMIVDADLIVVMDGGRIVQVGTHTELAAERRGLYRRLCECQGGE